MKGVWWLVLCSALMAKSLDLPVYYDPFAKAKKIVKEAKKGSLTPLHKPSGALVLIAIFGDKAFINDRFYKVGQKVGGYVIVRIASTYVVLKKKGKTKILPLGKKHILKVESK